MNHGSLIVELCNTRWVLFENAKTYLIQNIADLADLISYLEWVHLDLAAGLALQAHDGLAAAPNDQAHHLVRHHDHLRGRHLVSAAASSLGRAGHAGDARGRARAVLRCHHHVEPESGGGGNQTCFLAK